MHHDITAADTVSAAFFYVTTGFHGLHVLGGVIWMGIILYRTLVQNVYTAENISAWSCSACTGHFVDVVDRAVHRDLLVH